MSAPSSAPAPQLSVVIASIVGAPFIDDCLESVRAQAAELGAEVIVVACGATEYADRIRRAFPWVRVIHRPERETVPELRRYGVQEARGEIVAIIEEHCLAAPDWLRCAAAAHARGDYGAVGGPVADHAYSRLTDWVVYFVEYNSQLPPVPAGESTFVGGANIAYRRRVLRDHWHLLGLGYWEATLHPALLAEGITLLCVPEMVVQHRGPFEFGYYLQQRYWFSRAFAGARAQSLSAAHRVAYLVTAPVLPFVLLARMAWRVWQKRCRVGKFAMSVPLLLPALTVYVAGEWMGYLAGPGDALSKVE